MYNLCATAREVEHYLELPKIWRTVLSQQGCHQTFSPLTGYPLRKLQILFSLIYQENLIVASEVRQNNKSNSIAWPPPPIQPPGQTIISTKW